MDVDGVVCIGNTYDEWNPVATAYFRKAIVETGAKVVMSSTWRTVDPELMYKRLEESNMTMFLHDDPVTKDMVKKMSMRAHRGTEVQEWLDRHPEVTEYVIVDDVNDFFFTQYPRLVKTDESKGFTKENYEQVVKMFNKQKD